MTGLWCLRGGFAGEGLIRVDFDSLGMYTSNYLAPFGDLCGHL